MNDLVRKLGDGPGLVSVRPVTDNVKVGREGTAVLLQIGNSVIRMKWQTALTIGQWLMSRATEAKFLDGESKRYLIDPDKTAAEGGGRPRKR